MELPAALVDASTELLDVLRPQRRPERLDLLRAPDDVARDRVGGSPGAPRRIRRRGWTPARARDHCERSCEPQQRDEDLDSHADLRRRGRWARVTVFCSSTTA